MNPTNPVFSFQHPDESPGYLLWQVSMLWQRLLKKELDRLELTHTQFVLLAALTWLASQQAEVTQTDLANHANIDKMMTSKVLRTLEEKGLVLRQDSSTDTRAKIIRLSPQGEQLIAEAVKVVEKTDQDFFSPVQHLPFQQAMLQLLKQE